MVSESSGTASKGRLRLRQVKSAIGYDQRQRATLRGLGIRRLHQVVEVEDTPSVRGMITKVRHLIALVED